MYGNNNFYGAIRSFTSLIKDAVKRKHYFIILFLLR